MLLCEQWQREQKQQGDEKNAAHGWLLNDQ
jgi:hypothetical protein